MGCNLFKLIKNLKRYLRLDRLLVGIAKETDALELYQQIRIVAHGLVDGLLEFIVLEVWRIGHIV